MKIIPIKHWTGHKVYLISVKPKLNGQSISMFFLLIGSSIFTQVCGTFRCLVKLRIEKTKGKISNKVGRTTCKSWRRPATLGCQSAHVLHTNHQMFATVQRPNSAFTLVNAQLLKPNKICDLYERVTTKSQGRLFYWIFIKRLLNRSEQLVWTKTNRAV